MWIIVPLIFFLSWRSHRRIGQALNETFAWTVGYLGTAGAILLTDWGGVGMFSTRPTDPGAAVAVLGGFVAMYVSRYRWRRRGGHLQPTENRWTRSLAAMRAEGQPKAAATAKPRPAASANASATTRPAAPAQGAASGQAPKSRPPSASNTSTAYKLGRAYAAMTRNSKSASPAPTGRQPATSPDAPTSTAPSASDAQQPAARRPAQKTKPNRWMRALGAMMDDPKQGSKPGR